MKRQYSVFLLFLIFFSNTSFSFSCLHKNGNLSCLEYINNYDGDTITFNIPGLHPLIGSSIKVRLNGIDTAEIKGSRPCEKKIAILTKNFVRSILEEAKVIELKEPKRGKYFRIIGDILVDSVNIGNLLLEKKLAIPYDGGHKADYDWCQVKGFST